MSQQCFDFPRVRCLADFPISIRHQEHVPYFPMVFPIFSYFPIFFPMFSQVFSRPRTARGRIPRWHRCLLPCGAFRCLGPPRDASWWMDRRATGPGALGESWGSTCFDAGILTIPKRYPLGFSWDFMVINRDLWNLPSGKRLQFANLKMAGPVEIVDFPINSMVIFHGYVSLPEGKYC